MIEILDSEAREAEVVGAWLRARSENGLAPDEFALFVRAPAQIERACACARAAGLPFSVLDEAADVLNGKLTIGTMHVAKGLEFRAVAVIACDDEVVPLQARIEAIADNADLEDVYSTERHLLYVACMRARDQLLVTGVSPALRRAARKHS